MAFGKEKIPLAQKAKQRLSDGHTVLVFETETRATFNGGIHDEISDTIEEIESAGWHLDHSVINGQRWQLVFRAA